MSRAEQAFVAGNLESARADLAELRQLAGDQAAVFHLLALVERKAGNAEAAGAAFNEALRLEPGDPQINSNYANLRAAVGDSDAALELYGRAIAAAPSFLDARFNRAMLLEKMGRLDEALEELDQLIARKSTEARFHSARGAVLRSLDRLSTSADAFDKALALDPKRLVALHGRARVAMERGEDGAAALYEKALAVGGSNAELRLGLAEALEAEGRASEGLNLLADTVASQPEWPQGQALLARMRWEAGEGKAFTRTLEAAAEALRSPALWGTLAATLAGADLHAEAADAAARGAALSPDDASLRLAEASYASRAGLMDRAGNLFAGLPPGLNGLSLSKAWHALRIGSYEEAAMLLDSARDDDPSAIEAWALTGLAWRLTGDSRVDWLYNQGGLVGVDDLGLDETEIEAIASRLRSLHRTRAHPIAQSLRGGTQTRGRLFERGEPEVMQLGERIRVAVDRYWQALPPLDETHPLLRHRNGHPHIAGSWSVRLTGGGFHVAHYHSRGIVSSAAYLVVPRTEALHEGWLEVGGPPADLNLPLEPLRQIEPMPGRLALFPSFMFHGTKPFSEGERLTAAFDVVAS
jgi:tetratricopeptide (TPR) repeat protein